MAVLKKMPRKKNSIRWAEQHMMFRILIAIIRKKHMVYGIQRIMFVFMNSLKLTIKIQKAGYKKWCYVCISNTNNT